LDLRGKRLALFIDAGCATSFPTEFYAIGAASVFPAPSTHVLPPQEVLGVYRQVAGAEPPPSFVLCVRGEHFELGEGLSVSAQANVESAWRQLMQLCHRPDVAHWRALATNR
ncbi:MAG: homospermidine synthase, partial [Pseudomonadota bacterium]